MPAPKSISSADLAKFAQAAVKKVSGSARIVKGPIWGYILNDVRTAKQLDLATAVTTEITAAAKAGGITGLKLQPRVVIKPGQIIAGFIERELNIPIQQ